MLGLLAVWLLQGSPDAALLDVRVTLREMSAQIDRNKATFGATAAMTSAKHALRGWIEGRLQRADSGVDVIGLNAGFHSDLRRADLLCDDCDQNVLGYLDAVRVSRAD